MKLYLKIVRSKDIEERIKELLGISDDEVIVNIYLYQKKGKDYYRIETYSLGQKRGFFYHIPRKLESEILSLWRKREELRKQEQEIKEVIGELLRKYQNPELIRKVLEELLQGGLKREVKDFTYQKFKKEAMELYEKFKPYLFRLKKEGMRRISILQALFLLANIYEFFKDGGEEELQKALNRAVMTILLRDRNKELDNPFGVLKNDLFLPKETPYNFLLSPFLSMELEEILEKLLEAEKEKIETQEAMAEISDFVANLSQKAKDRVLKVFPSFSEFSKAFFENWKKSKEDLKEFLTEWKSYLEMEVSKTEEKHIIEFLKSLNET